MLVIEITCLLILTFSVIYGILNVLQGSSLLLDGEISSVGRIFQVILIGISCVGLWWLYTRIIAEVI